MAAEATLVREKLEQAPAILAEHGVDLWLTLVRETLLTRDPSLDLVAGTYCAWQSAFLVSRSGERIAIVGRHDATSVEQLEAYDEVVAYDESIRPGLRETVARLAPESIALNYSQSDPAADGLTHGLWLVLREALEGTPYADRIVSSAPVVNSLRGRKSPAELERIRAAVEETETILALAGAELRPGLKETEIAALLHAEVSHRGLGYAWEPSHCPAVNAGPEKDVGHSAPGELTTRRGQLLHCDFGVEKGGYCSDLQRVWYLLDDGESRPPADVRDAWDAVWAAVDAGAAALRPGALGHEVDAAARERLVSAGLPEPKYALGHQLGRSAHDGGTILGPPGTGTGWRHSGPSRRETCSRSSSGRPSRAAAMSGSRRMCSSPRTASSG